MSDTVQTNVTANVLGTIGTVFWCIQLVPQIWHNWRKKTTEGLPALMMFAWALSGIPFGAYAILKGFNIPLQCQAQIFTLLSLAVFAQIMYYQHGWNKLRSWLTLAALSAFFGGLEAAMVFPTRMARDKGTTWPIQFIGIIAVVLLVAGLLPPYYEIYKRKGRVVGINFIFLTIDSLGAIFSFASIVAQRANGEPLDALGSICYLSVLVLESGIFVAQGVWLLRNRRKKNAADTADTTLPDNDIETAQVSKE